MTINFFLLHKEIKDFLLTRLDLDTVTPWNYFFCRRLCCLKIRSDGDGDRADLHSIHLLLSMMELLFVEDRARRKSGPDDLCTSPSRSQKGGGSSSGGSGGGGGAIFEALRPRSKSDATRAVKRPTIMSTVKNAVHVSLQIPPILKKKYRSISTQTSQKCVLTQNPKTNSDAVR